MKRITQKQMARMGGHARAAKLTEAQKSTAGRKAAKARWAKWRAANGH